MNQPFPPPDPHAAVPQPEYAPAAAPPRKRRSKAPLAIGALVVVALVGGGAFAVASMSGDDDGASSPEAAVQQLFDAVDDQDVLGVLDALAPGERESFTDSLTGMVDELERLGVMAEGTDLSSFPGVDIDVRDLTFTTEDIGEGVATVTVTGGTVGGSYDLADLPIGDTLVDTVLGGERPEGTDTSAPEAIDPGLRITTVRRGGGWYVSLWYSLAEQARVAAGMDAPAFGQGVVARGAASPEAAVEALMVAALHLDLEAAVALLPPDEMGVLHDYAPLFLPAVQDAVADLEFTSSLDGFRASADRDGDEARVSIEAFTASVSAQGETLTLASDGECVVLSVPGEPEQRICRDDASATDLLDGLGLGGLFDPNTSVAIRTVQVDGAWYVSPTRSLMGLTEDMLSGIDADAFRSLLEQVTDQPERFLEELVGRAMTEASGGLGGSWAQVPSAASSSASP